MRDVYAVLREKEKAIQRVDREIRVLRLAAPLLSDDTDAGPVPVAAPAAEGVGDAQKVRPNRTLPTARPPDSDDSGRWRTEATDDVKSAPAKKISARLKRLLATPLLNADRFAS